MMVAEQKGEICNNRICLNALDRGFKGKARNNVVAQSSQSKNTTGNQSGSFAWM